MTRSCSPRNRELVLHFGASARARKPCRQPAGSSHAAIRRREREAGPRPNRGEPRRRSTRHRRFRRAVTLISLPAGAPLVVQPAQDVSSPSASGCPGRTRRRLPSARESAAVVALEREAGAVLEHDRSRRTTPASSVSISSSDSSSIRPANAHLDHGNPCCAFSHAPARRRRKRARTAARVEPPAIGWLPSLAISRLQADDREIASGRRTSYDLIR